MGRAGYWFIARYGELLESAGLALELLHQHLEYRGWDTTAFRAAFCQEIIRYHQKHLHLALKIVCRCFLTMHCSFYRNI